MQEMRVEVAQGSTKIPAPEGTPDREAQATTKTQASDLMPRTMPTEIQDPISKVEISGHNRNIERRHAWRNEFWHCGD